MARFRLFLPWVLALLTSACADDDATSRDTDIDTESDTDAGTSSSTTATGTTDGGTDTEGPSETRALFDLDADLTAPETFYGLPYPLDLRLDAAGNPSLAGMPRTMDSLSVSQVLQAAQERPGWPAVGAVYFAFDGPVATQDISVLIPAASTSAILLLDIDPASADRGTLYPAIADTPAADNFVPENLLAVGPYSGQVLPGDRTYAVVVQRGLLDAEGRPLGVPDALAAMASGQTPTGSHAAELTTAFAPLWETLDLIGVARTEVAAATVFTVEDIPLRTLEMSELVVAQHDISIENLALEADGGADHERFCELRGSIQMPQFNKGTAPYDDDGSFDYDAEGAPVKQRDETVPIVFTIPKREMPEGGFPLLYYIHGSGGLAAQLVDRGPVTAPGGPEAPGLGPAHVVAEHGIAGVGAAMPLNPERTPTADDIDYINIANPRTFGYVFRQGTFEQRLIIEALDGFTIEPSVLEACTGPSLPASETAYRFDLDTMMLMGQSMGAQYSNILGAIEPRVRALVPTGAGGLWSKFLGVSPLFDGDVKLFTSGLLGIAPDAVNQLHPGVNLIETGWEPGEQIVYVPRLARRPIDEQPARHVYEPVAPTDGYFPTTLFDAMAIAYGNQQAGDEVWSSMQPELAVFGLDGIAPYPVSSNRTNSRGDDTTQVVVQYEPDAFLDGHYIMQQLDAVKYQYGCFFASYQRDGMPTVPAPAALGTPCP